MAEKYTNLKVGYDLGNGCVQIACYNERKDDVDSVCLPGRKSADMIPLILAKNLESDQWICGEDAENNAGAGWIILRDFLKDYETEPTIYSGGGSFTKKELLFTFVELSLELIRRYYPHGKIEWLTFTSAAFSRSMLADLTELGRRLDIAPEHLKIQSHISSYENYALCQPRELWGHDVGLFEYSEQGLSYVHLTINRRRSPMVVSAGTVPLNAYLSGDDYQKLAPVELDRRFQSVVKEVLNNKTVSVIYLVGRGFEGDWMNVSLKTLCANRKVFIGQNLYARGACYNSVLEAAGMKNRNFIGLNDEMVPVNIYLQVSRGKESFRYDLVKAGSDWYSIHENAQFILDGTQTVVLHALDFVTNKEKLIPFKLENLPDRPNRTTRIDMRLAFENDRICEVIMEDKGFGSLYPSTGKVWKKRLNVVEYEAPANFKPEGRLILNRDVHENVPYYFQVSGVKVYSVEELCYYIYENIYAVNKETFSEDLLYWLEKDMNEVSLTRGLKNLLKSESQVKELVRYLMNCVDYYSSEENARLMKIMDEIASQNPTESRKLEADNYVRYCRYMEAIRVYNNVVYEMEHESADAVSREFKANTWHNLGCAYTRVMNFAKAGDCFKRAWRIGEDIESLKCFLWTARFLNDETAFTDMADKSGLDETEITEIIVEFDRVAKDAKSSKNEKIKHVQLLKNAHNRQDFDQLAKACLEELKEWYRN